MNIAIIGMSCRFPGADNVETFWNNLVDGLETIKRFTKEELRAEGVSDELLNHPHYVRAKGILNDIERFDANFFGYNPHDARITDPQQKIFFECAWQALEAAGCVPEKYAGLIGVYASMADSLYLQNNLLKNEEYLKTADWFQSRMGTSLTTLSTQLSYRLNLTGPSVNITTACSSSLVAIATACRALIDYDCDVAIAGASAITVPQKSGYLFQTDGIESSDGHCKAFEQDAEGTVFSNGVGVVILKRLQDAIDDNDTIQAVIKGWNVNNDGSDKVGFTAPSVNGQAKCVVGALAFAEVNPDSISYLEAHGTGTALGDLIELNALTKAFSSQTKQKQFCAIGSVKTNIGHTDIAAGMAAFIKTVLALKNKIIPPTLHYRHPNPKIDFPNTPFFVNAELKKWDFGALPRRAGVNASGIGGTNAFLMLEEFEPSHNQNSSRPYQLMLLSAKTKAALDITTKNIAQNLRAISQSTLADVAFTLQTGRADFDYRRMLVCVDSEDALFKLKHLPHDGVFSHYYKTSIPKIVFMFPGQGTQYVGMAKELYHSEPVFAEWIDRCFDILEESVKELVSSLIFQTAKSDSASVHDTLTIQPALFIVEYSLAKWLINLGVKPNAMIGHSIGEYVAACLADVMCLEDALNLICIRAKLMASTCSGTMLAVQMGENELLDFLQEKPVSIAAINSPTSCVISGDISVIAEFEEMFKKQNITTCRLRISHAFHSEMMNSILDDFRRLLKKIDLQPPRISFISNVTGMWITDEEAVDPDYWARHLRQTVRFLPGLKTVLNEGINIFLEVGVGKTLSGFARELIKNDSAICVTNVLPGPKESVSDQACLLLALGQLWLYGLKINWTNFYKQEQRKKIPLATYPFERKKYWINPDNCQKTLVSNQKQLYPHWFYEPSWVRASLLSNPISEDLFIQPRCWIIFLDNEGVGENISRILLGYNQLVITVKQGESYAKLNNSEFMISVKNKKDYQRLVAEVVKTTDLELNVINLFPVTSEHDTANLDLVEVNQTVDLCFYSTLFFSQVLIEQSYEKNINILIVGNEMYSVTGRENIYPAKATATGPCRVIPQEHLNFKIRILDITLNNKSISDQIILEMLCEENNPKENIIAYRDSFRWIQIFKPLKVKTDTELKLNPHGVYVFTGGLGGVSLTLAKSIAQSAQKPKFILISRTVFPLQEDWDVWLQKQGQENSTSKKILYLKTIENLGAEVTLLQSDVTDFDELKLTLEVILKKFGVINGVVHAAGVAGGGLVQLKTVEMANRVLAPKVVGTYALTYLLKDQPLDFFLLCSSVSAIIGELSQVDYCAANACLDAFVHSENYKTVPLTVINWNTWRDIGMAVETERPRDVTYFDRNNDISPEEGAKIFSDVLHQKHKQAIVSTFDINAYIDLMNQNKDTDAPQIAIERDTILGEGSENYVPPTNDIELELVKIWQNILGIEKIGIRDDFFALGGHSLMALRLLVKIQEKLHVKISLQALQETKIIQALSQKIQALKSAKKDNFSDVLIPIRTKGDCQPLFCFHPVGGTVFCYLPLAKHLNFDCPIYGLQDPSFEQSTCVFKRLEDMASCYIEAIQTIQPHGPYLLCGLSFGATLAVEVARQLRNKDEAVKPLILFDGWAKFSDQQHLEEIFKAAIFREHKSLSVDKNFAELSWERMRLLLNYQIPEIKDKLILFKAQKLLPEYQSINHPNNYWDHYTKGCIDTYVIPGDHETMLAEPNVLTLTQKLDSILALLTEHKMLERELV
jgi:polyketide synthase PksJ